MGILRTSPTERILVTLFSFIAVPNPQQFVVSGYQTANFEG